MFKNRSYLIRYALSALLCLLFISVLPNSSMWTDTSRSGLPAVNQERLADDSLAARPSPESGGPLKPYLLKTYESDLSSFRAEAAIRASLTSPLAAMITATKTDQLLTDVNMNGKADPGDTLMYSVTITNSGAMDATNVTFTDMVDSNTTLVGGSVAASPIAVNDTYQTIGNVNISVPAAQGVLSNDLNPNVSGTLTITAFDATSTGGGTVTVNADGSFTYNPAAGFRGPTDTFTYTLSNGTGKTDMATVTITINGMIWFIDDSAAAGGDGRLTNPFNCLVGAGCFDPAASDQTGDNIFLFSGSYTGGLTLLDDQKLIGQGAPDSILTITTLPAPSGTNFLPATNGADPMITTSGATAITLGEDNQLHGFTVGNTGAAGTDVSGTSFGNLTVKDVTLNGTGQALNLMTGTIMSGSTFPTVESSGGSPAQGIRLNAVGGSFTITTTNIVNPTGTGIDVQNATVAMGGFNFGSTTVNKGSSAGTGVNLNANTGITSFTSLAVTTSNGTGISATNAGTVNVSGGSVNATGGPAILSNPTTLGMTFSTVSSSASASTGISLTNPSGSLSITTTTITNATGIGINVQGLTMGGSASFGTTSITNPDGDTTGSTGVRLIDNVGNVSFGDLDITPENNQRGLHVTNNVANSGSITTTSGTISANGAIAVEVNRTSAGTIPLMMTLTTVTDSNATNGINLTKVSGFFTIAGTGSANSGGTISNSSSDAVFLSTATNITLTDMSITTSGGSHIDATSVNGLDLTRVNTDLSTDHGIRGSVVTDLNILGGTFDRGGAGNALANFNGVEITNLLGTSSVIGATFRRSNTIQFHVVNNTATNFAGAPDTLTVSDTDWNTHNGPFAGDHLSVFSDTGGNFRIIVNDSVGINTVNEGGGPSTGGGIGVQAAAGGTNGKMDASVTGLKTTNNTAGVAIAETGGGSITYNVFGNKTANGTGFSSTGSLAIVVTHASSGGTSSGTINDNSINHTAGPGTNALQVVVEGNGTGTAVISNNVISGNYQRGIQAQARAGTGTLNLTINNNTLTGTDTTGVALQQVNLEAGGSGSGHANTICLNMFNNSVNLGPGATYLAAYRLINRTGCTYLLQNFAGNGMIAADVQNWVTTTKSNSGTPVSVTVGPGFGTSSGCATPMAPMSFTALSVESAESTNEAPDTTESANGDDVVVAHLGRGEGGDDVQKLSDQELTWLVQAALQRWRQVGISTEDIVRLEAVSFEVADLPDAQLAEADATRIKIDETAADYGWYFDQFPMEDSEFEVLVPNRELQTTDLSPANGKMDLLTVIMRELGHVYLQGKKEMPDNLRPLMENSLAPAVRRLPLDQLRTTLSPISSIKPSANESLIAQSSATARPEMTQTDSDQPAASQVESDTAKIPYEARYAVFNPTTNQPDDSLRSALKPAALRTNNLTGARTSRANRALRVASFNPALAPDVTIGPFTLPPGESVSIMFNVTIDTPVTPAGTTQVCNQGSVTFDGGPMGGVLTDDPDVGGSADPTCTQLAQADLAVTKSDSPDPVFAGSDITYTIDLTNNGPDTAFNALLTDAIPANTTLVSVTTPMGWTRTDSVPVGGTGTLMFTKAMVANAETAQFTVVVKVDNAALGGTIITNNAVATSDTPDGMQGNNTGTATTTVQAQADLEIVSKTDAPDPVLAGNNITYTISFINNGPGTATNTTVTDAVPANTTFVSAMVTSGSGWSTSAPAVGGTGNVVFSKASVANGETATFQIVVKVDSNTASGSTITNTATAASSTGDPTPANDSKTATTSVNTEADLAVTKGDSPDPVIAGNNITYTINFVNNGPSDAQNVTVTDAVPANTTFVSAMVTTGSGWSTTAPAVGGTGNVVFSKATVAAGETATFTIVVKVNSNTANGSTITNTATAATDTTDPTPGNNSATATTTVQTQADLAVTKGDSPDPVIAGNNITYTINFVNNGPSDAQNVSITDSVPANTTFVSAMVTSGSGWSTSAPAVGGTGNVTFTKGTVAAGETATFTIVVNVNTSAANGSTITNTVTAATDTTDPTPGNNSATATTTVAAQADLAVMKSDAPDPAFAGGNITYTISFTNNGPSDASTVMVTDAVPANTTFVSAMVTSGSGWSTSAPAVGGTGNVVFSKAMVAAGETATFTIVVNVNSGVAGGTVISNTATAASSTTDPVPGNNSATAMTTVQTQADLAVTKSDSPDPVVAGNNITYTISLTNNGPSDASTVTVTDAVPANTTFVSAMVTSGSGWSTSAPAVGGTGNVVFSKAMVATGETATFQIVVNVNASVTNGTIITNTATVASSTADPVPGNDSATAMTTVQTQADLAMTKTDSPDPVIAGNNITYTINFTNNGPSDAINAMISDAVPTDATFVSAMVTMGSGWSTTAPAVGGTGNVAFTKGTVAAGETATFTIVVNVNTSAANGSTITNTATAASDTTDPTPGNNSATATTTVNTQADLAVTKGDAPDPVAAGNNITYTISFTNNGPSDAATVTVTDAVPSNTTFVSAMVTMGSGWSTSAPAVGGTGNVVFSKATVAAGETATFTIVVKVNSNTASGSTITNTATAASTTTDPVPGNDSAMATTTVQTQADLAVTKTDSPDPVIAGGNITYTISFTNNGPSDASTVTVTDAVPANTTFVSAMVTSGSGWSTSAPAVGGTGNVIFSKATVAGGETATFQIVVKVNSGTAHNTVITNSATAASATTDPNPGNNTATAMTTVIAEADLAVTKSDAPDPACVNGNITYTINFINNGPGPGINTTVTDAVPAGTTFVSAMVTSGTGWTITSPAMGGTGNVIFSKASVGIGETAVFHIVVKVNGGTVSGAVITNTVTTASSINDPNPTNNSAMTTTTVDPVAPTITCPANVTAVGSQGSASVIVNYPAPVTADNCGVASVVCNPPSGSAFPLGVTTVTCVVTDTAGNTAQCSFTVSTFDVCIEDDANPGNSILFISTGPLSGTYRICCGGQTLTGKGTIGVKNGILSLVHNTSSRRLQAFLYMNQQKGTAALQSPVTAFPCTINDSNVTNSNCSCAAP